MAVGCRPLAAYAPAALRARARSARVPHREPPRVSLRVGATSPLADGRGAHGARTSEVLAARGAIAPCAQGGGREACPLEMAHRRARSISVRRLCFRAVDTESGLRSPARVAGTMGFAPGRVRGATLRRACCRAPYVGRPRRVRCVAPGYGALLTVRWRIGRSNVRRYESADDLERCSVCVAWKVEKQELTGTRRRCRTRAASASTILACCGELPPGREASSAQWDLRRDSVALV